MEFTLTATISASAEAIYQAWLKSDSHTEMTGGEAEITNNLNEEFTAWDGYISGKNLELIPNKKIKQTWRTTEFKDSDEDSIIEVSFENTNDGTKITLVHTNLSEDGEQYINGWKEHYFKPMKDYFEK